MQNIAITFTLLASVLFFSNTNAQNLNLNSISIKSDFKYTINSELVDTNGSFNSKEYSLGINLPLYNHYFQNKDMKTALFSLSLVNSNKYIKNDIGILGADNDLYNISLGIRALYYTGNKNIWLTKLSSNFFEDEYSINNPEPRFSGAFLFNRIVNRNFYYHLGLTYKYSFGYAAILPVAGLKYQFADKWKILLFLPFHISTQYKLNEKLLLEARFNASGYVSYYSNKNNLFGQTNERMLFRKKANTIAINAKYRINSSLTLNAAIGREANRAVYFSDIKSEINKEPQNYFKSNIRNTMFVNLGFVFKIGDKKNRNTEVESEITDYIDDFLE